MMKCREPRVNINANTNESQQASPSHERKYLGKLSYGVNLLMSSMLKKIYSRKKTEEFRTST